jgi:hypothetical protein
MREVIPFKQNRFAGQLGQGIGETIPKIQTGGVPTALSEIAVRFPSNPRLSFRYRFGYKLSLAEKVVKAPARDRISAPIDNERCFDVIDGRNAAVFRTGNRPRTRYSFWLSTQDGDYSRRIDDHRGSPLSL